MECATEWERVRTQLVVIGVMLALALTAGIAAMFLPWGYDVASCLLAAGMSAIATELSRRLVGLIEAYQTCRDRTEGPSQCSLGSFWQTFQQFTGLISSVSFLIAAACLVIPWLGKLLGSGPLISGIVSTGAALLTLAGLVTALAVYNACRDQAAEDPGPIG
jgi:hypothetical protein